MTMAAYYNTPQYARTNYSCASYSVPAVPRLCLAEPAPTRPSGDDLVDLIGVDKAWTPQRYTTPTITDDPAMAMLREKADLGKMTVGSLVYQMIQRERFKDENLLRIRYQEVEIDGHMMRIDDMWWPYPAPSGDRMKAGLEAELIRLEQQKRLEEIECWRDIARLKERLLEALGLYGDAARRERMVGTTLPAGTTVAGRM
jgi:hypothetical protein